MRVEPLDIPGLLLLTPRVHRDHRGYLVEAFHAARYADAGVDATFVQDNLSRSQRGVLRGLHFQDPRPQGKLVTVLQGAVLDVAVDLREGSPTFGRHVALRLDGHRKAQLWMPPGFAHGFCALEDDTLLHYKCTAVYAPEHEHTLRYDDPDLGIEWPDLDLVVSAKDRAGMALAELPLARG